MVISAMPMMPPPYLYLCDGLVYSPPGCVVWFTQKGDDDAAGAAAALSTLVDDCHAVRDGASGES